MPFYRKLALYSSQDAAANKEMDRRLLRLIGRSQPRIGYVPAEADPGRSDFRRKADYYAAIGAEVGAYVAPGEPASGSAWSALLSCEAIHLAGGNTFSFLSWLRRAEGLPRLAQYVAEGGVLIGESAGAILMTPAIDAALLCGDIRDDPSMNTAALGLVDFCFWPHFDAANISQEQTRLAAGIPFLYACPDGSGIVVDGEEVAICGEVRRYRPATVFPPSVEDEDR